jgi:hypothetical protein
MILTSFPLVWRVGVYVQNPFFYCSILWGQ